MKERELFAALAMQELLRWELADNKENKINIVALSKNAYLMADEMIKVGDVKKMHWTKYNSELINSVIDEYKNGKTSIRDLENKYDIPKSTIHQWIKNDEKYKLPADIENIA